VNFAVATLRGPDWMIDVGKILSIPMFRVKMLCEIDEEIFQLLPCLANIITEDISRGIMSCARSLNNKSRKIWRRKGGKESTVIPVFPRVESEVSVLILEHTGRK
jgi:hypothetical protein